MVRHGSVRLYFNFTCCKGDSSNEKARCLAYIGDEILPSYMGIIINLILRIPIQTTRIQPKVSEGFLLVAQLKIKNGRHRKSATYRQVGEDEANLTSIPMGSMGLVYLPTFIIQ